MSTVTPNQGIVIPVDADSADAPQAFTDQTAGLESRVVLRYTNLADRAARNLAPVEGQITDLAAENRMDAYDGAAYISAAVRGLYARRMRTTNAAAINASTVLVSDAVLTVALDTTGTYRFNGRIYYDSSATADIKLAFTFPAVAASGAKWGLLGRNSVTNTNIDAIVATASGSALAAGGTGVGTSTFIDFDGFINITATGNLVTQYAQNTSDATNTTVQFGSYLEVAKVG
jgi:hypothetical protein